MSRSFLLEVTGSFLWQVQVCLWACMASTAPFRVK